MTAVAPVVNSNGTANPPIANSVVNALVSDLHDADAVDPIDIVESLLVQNPPDLASAKEILKSFLRQSPYSRAWKLFLEAHELSTTQPLPDAVHQEWMKSVGADCAAARLYISVARHIAGPNRLMTILSSSGVGVEAQRVAALGKAKFILELAMSTPMDELDEVAKAYEPIAGAVLEAQQNALAQAQTSAANIPPPPTSSAAMLMAARSGVGGSVLGLSLMTPQLKRKFEAGKAIFDYEGAWPQRHHSATSSRIHVRAWSATLQKLFSTYVCLATTPSTLATASSSTPTVAIDNSLFPKPFPSAVEHHISLLAPEEITQLRNSQVRRIQLAMRQALAQCPNEEILLVHYCAFVAAVTNSTAEAKAALMAHLNAQYEKSIMRQGINGMDGQSNSKEEKTTSTSAVGKKLPLFSPALATLAVALTKIESASDLFELLKSSTAPSVIAQANNVLDLSLVANRKRFREFCNEAKEAEEHKRNRWHVFAEWLEVECNTIDNRNVAATIAEKGFEQLRVAATQYETEATDALALFAHRSHRMYSAHGKPEQALLIAEILVNHLSKQTFETVITGNAETETGRRLASAPVNTLKEACALLGVKDNDEATRYVLGGRAPQESSSALNIAITHSAGLGPSLPLLSPEEAQWATIVQDLHESSLRYSDDTGYKVPNEMKRRFHRLGQALPWGGEAEVEDMVSSELLEPYVLSQIELAEALKYLATVSTSASSQTIAANGDNEEEASIWGWRPFVPPANPLMKEMYLANPDSDEIRAPFAIRGAANRSITVDERTLRRIERQESYRSIEGAKRGNANALLEQFPTKIVKLLKRIPAAVDGCARISETDTAWLMANAFTNVPLDWASFVEANKKAEMQV